MLERSHALRQTRHLLEFGPTHALVALLRCPCMQSLHLGTREECNSSMGSSLQRLAFCTGHILSTSLVNFIAFHFRCNLYWWLCLLAHRFLVANT